MTTSNSGNEILRRRGVILIDSREQNAMLKEAADEVRFLHHPGPNGEPWSYDVMVITKAGQALTYERKTTADCIASFDKLERQTSYTTGLIVEWNLAPLRLTERWEDPKYQALADSTEKRLWRLAHRQPVILTHDVAGTIRFLRYLASRTEPIDVRGAPAAPTEPPKPA